MTAQTMLHEGTASQQASARAHFERRDTWHHVRVNGTRYVMMTSATSGHLYAVRADGKGCSCKAYQKWNYPVCAHMLAIRLEAQERAEIERQHQAALAAWIDTMDEPAPKPRVSYATLYPTCYEPGCQNDPEPDSGGCWKHCTVSAF